MPPNHPPIDPAVHGLSLAIAKKCLWVIQAVLREEERKDALMAFYEAARECIEKNPTDYEEV